MKLSSWMTTLLWFGAITGFALPAGAQDESTDAANPLDESAGEAAASAPTNAQDGANKSASSGDTSTTTSRSTPRTEQDDDLPIKVSIHGLFDNRFMIYSSNVNFTTSNSRRTIATTTATEGRGDLYQIPGPLNADGTRDRQTGWAQEGVHPDLPRLDGVKDMFAEIRYEPRIEIATPDGFVRGVWQLEIGGVRFGSEGVGRQQGGSFSTDATNIETRLAFTELNFENHQLQLGLIPLVTNRHLWQESAAGVQLSGSLWSGGGYHAAWARGVEDRREPRAFPEDPLPAGFQDMDAFFLELSQMLGGQRISVFGMYQRGAVERDAIVFPTEVFAEGMALQWFGSVDHDLVSFGGTAAFNFGPIYANIDAIVQSGTFRDLDFYAADNFSRDPNSGFARPSARAANICEPTDANCYPEITQSGFAARLELGGVFGPLTAQYTGYYISGDPDPTDDKFENFISTDVDFFDSSVFFQGVLVNDTVHRQEPYLFDKGFFLNKISVDYRFSDALTIGGAVVHNQLAEELSWLGVDGTINPETGDFFFDPDTLKLNPSGPFRSKDLGLEVQLRGTYQVNDHLSVGGLVASLVAPGDAMDFYEVSIQRNGTPDQDYLTVQSNLQFTF